MLSGRLGGCLLFRDGLSRSHLLNLKLTLITLHNLLPAFASKASCYKPIDGCFKIHNIPHERNLMRFYKFHKHTCFINFFLSPLTYLNTSLVSSDNFFSSSADGTELFSSILIRMRRQDRRDIFYQSDDPKLRKVKLRRELYRITFCSYCI